VPLLAAGDKAGTRVLEFFAATIRNPDTRHAQSRAAGEFLAWCERASIASIADIAPLHVATWVEAQTRREDFSAPSVKQQFASLRHLFDWLVVPRSPLTTRPLPFAVRSKS
jgi:site-specific recombinase XerD